MVAVTGLQREIADRGRVRRGHVENQRRGRAES
jgi:hypothetical protein